MCKRPGLNEGAHGVPKRDVVVIGGSVGAIEAMRALLGAMREEFAATILVVIHTSAQSPNVLAAIFDRAGPLPASFAADGERLLPGHVYVAPPDRHLMVEPGKTCVTRGPRENRFRPAVDPLFRSAAQVYGPRVIGVILSGGLNDGTSGLGTIKQLGGLAVVQDPTEAVAPSMPQSALQHVRIDHCVPLAEIAPLLVRLTEHEIVHEGITTMPEGINIEVKIAREEHAVGAGVLTLGELSLYACPECHGVLLQMQQDDLTRFRCHTGHGYTAESLMAEMDDKIEDALWSAIRSIEEQTLLMRHLAAHAPDGEGDRLRARGDALQRRANLVRQAAMAEDEPLRRGAAGGE
jgi:two-component system chemotaxis response regulator CheB